MNIFSSFKDTQYTATDTNIHPHHIQTFIQYLLKEINHFFQALIMDINVDNPPDEFDNPYDIDYELNQRENDELEPNIDDNEKEKSDDEAIVI